MALAACEQNSLTKQMHIDDLIAQLRTHETRIQQDTLLGQRCDTMIAPLNARITELRIRLAEKCASLPDNPKTGVAADTQDQLSKLKIDYDNAVRELRQCKSNQVQSSERYTAIFAEHSQTVADKRDREFRLQQAKEEVGFFRTRLNENQKSADECQKRLIVLKPLKRKNPLSKLQAVTEKRKSRPCR